MCKIARSAHPGLWSALSLISATMGHAPLDELELGFPDDRLDDLDAYVSKMKVTDLLVLAGVTDDESRFAQLDPSVVRDF